MCKYSEMLEKYHELSELLRNNDNPIKSAF